MMNGRVLLIATANPGKLREMRALFAFPGLELVSLADLRILQEVDEGSDYAENARRKAPTSAVRGPPACAVRWPGPIPEAASTSQRASVKERSSRRSAAREGSATTRSSSSLAGSRRWPNYPKRGRTP